ncbi:MFS general substrate transporter [Atractiella rhizophila]|nr:MFS general substrate transporter [Atractiella rhizophila]
MQHHGSELEESKNSSMDEKRPEVEIEAAQSKEEVPHEIEKDFPWSWKIIALVLGLLLSAGSSFSENTLGPLKKTLLKELAIDNAKYGALSSATSLINSILPIFGGFTMDYYGVDWTLFFSASAIFLGSIVSAAGTLPSVRSFGCVLGGRIIMGFGSTLVESAGSKILAHWFQRRGLAFVYGLDISWGKVIVLIAKATAVPMSNLGDYWGWGLWIPAILCFVNLLQTLFYIWWSRYYLPPWTRMPIGKTDSAIPNLKPLLKVPRFFWFISCTQILQNGVVGAFNSLDADIIRTTRGATPELAGYTSALQSLIPIFMSAALGAYFDQFGNRMLFVSFVSATWIIVYALIGYTTVNALAPVIISGFALAFNALPFTCSIPLLVPDQKQLGLALGVWKAFNNANSVVVDVAAGQIQNTTPGQSYDRVIAFFIAMKGLEFCLGLTYGVIDRRFNGGILSKSEKQRLKAEADHKLRIEDCAGRRPQKWFTIFGLCWLSSAVIVGWVLFIKYSL